MFFMKLKTISKVLDRGFRIELAEEWDNCGLLVGDPEKNIKRIGVSLDVELETIAECKKHKLDLLVTHHPLFLKPLKRVHNSGRVGEILFSLIRNNTALYCAHTNIDQLEWGTPMQLSRKLGLNYIRPLVTSGQSALMKLHIFVPGNFTEKVRKSMAAAGAGEIGNYSGCAYVTSGTGCFTPGASANPYTGTRGKLKKTEEDRLEMIVPRHSLKSVLRVMLESHPYEEPAYDIIALENTQRNIGWGAVCELETPLAAGKWILAIKKKLGIRDLRVANYQTGKRIKNIILMPGSGGSFIPYIPAGTDVFISGDLKYHDIQNGPDGLMMIDAGHAATEQPVMDIFRKKLEKITGLNTRKLTAIKTVAKTM